MEERWRDGKDGVPECSLRTLWSRFFGKCFAAVSCQQGARGSGFRVQGLKLSFHDLSTNFENLN